MFFKSLADFYPVNEDILGFNAIKEVGDRRKFSHTRAYLKIF